MAHAGRPYPFFFRRDLSLDYYPLGKPMGIGCNISITSLTGAWITGIGRWDGWAFTEELTTDIGTYFLTDYFPLDGRMYRVELKYKMGPSVSVSSWAWNLEDSAEGIVCEGTATPLPTTFRYRIMAAAIFPSTNHRPTDIRTTSGSFLGTIAFTWAEFYARS